MNDPNINLKSPLIINHYEEKKVKKWYHKTLYQVLIFFSFCIIISIYVMIKRAEKPGLKYKIKVTRLNSGVPINFENTTYIYNYNPTTYCQWGIDCGSHLFVRVQNITNPKDPYSVGPSSIGLSIQSKSTFTYSEMRIIIQGGQGESDFGAEDPRIFETREGKKLLFYSAVKTINKQVTSRLALATCEKDKDCAFPNSWVDHGPIFNPNEWSKSGALFSPSPIQNYLLYGDEAIRIADVSKDYLEYTKRPENTPPLVETRKNKFDSVLVESGPAPVQLDDGNFLFLYNSARHSNISNPKPNWDLEYNVGYIILGSAGQIIERSELPILSPVTKYEKCDGNDPLGLTPDVVFAEGLHPGKGSNTFILYYGACDSFVSVAELKVSYDNQK